MPEPARFPFVAAPALPRETGSLPLLPLTLQYQGGESLAVEGLLDTGATVNVLPYRIGLQLGATWDERAPLVRLTGNLANLEARALLVTGTVASFRSVRLAFAWSRSDAVPLLLGQ